MAALSSALLLLLLAPAPEAEGTSETPAPAAESAEADEEDRSAEEWQQKQTPDRAREYGPFFEDEPASDLAYPTQVRKPEHSPLSVGSGAFCFVENARCKASLILDAGIAGGVNAISTQRGMDVPYAQFAVRGGLTLHPLVVARGYNFHPWGLGVVSAWSLGSPGVSGALSSDEAFDDVVELGPIPALRFGVINQLWLSRRRNALHADITLGAVRSNVLQYGQFWGTHAEVGLGFAGWGGIFVGADFLDEDTRAYTGFRAHGILSGPIAALILAGLVAGGTAL